MLTEVRRCLDVYREKYRRSGLPDLELSGIYALFPEEGVPDFAEFRWNDRYPNAGRKGVYLLFGGTGRLLYIGKASMGASIGGRLGTWFAGKNECRLLSNDWMERPSYVATIAVPESMSFEAAALEEYLIRCLNPSDNKLGVIDELPLGGNLRSETPAPSAEGKQVDAAGSALPSEAGVYTYSAPGMPMCPMCGQRPAIFYCSAHEKAACLECVAKHDERGMCVYVPAYRAPKPPESPVTTPEPTTPTSAARPRSILGI